jgi:hypothetical protein
MTSNPTGRRHALVIGTALVGLMLALWQIPLAAAAARLVPPSIQAAVTLRILEYDRSLKTWAGARLTVGIVTREAGSADLAEYREALTGRTAQGLPLAVVEHVYRDTAALRSWIQRDGVRLLYVSPDLEQKGAEVVAAGAARNLPMLVATRPHFKAGAVLGIVLKDDRPHILVSLAPAKAAGMDLDPKLLQLAEVVR